MAPWRVVDANYGDVETQNGALESQQYRPMVADLHHFDKEQDPDPH
jgi:hypothetical protein